MEDVILLVYPTYEGSPPPRVLSLERNYTVDQFCAFLSDFAAVVNKPQGGYEHVKMTVDVLVRKPAGWSEELSIEL